MFIIKGAFRKYLKYSFLILDYIFWFLFDFSKFKAINKNKIKKILIFHNGAIGEVLMTTCLIEPLKRLFNAKIVYMVEKGKEDLIKNNPNVDSVIIYKNNFELDLKKIKNQKIDLLILVRSYFKLAWLSRKVKIPYVIGGFGGLNRAPSFFLNKKLFPKLNDTSLNKNFSILKLIIPNIQEKAKIKIFSSKKDELTIINYIKKNKLKDYVIIHPGYGLAHLGDNSKKWAIRNYSIICDYITDIYGYKVLLTGSVKEKPMISDIKNQCINSSKIIDASGRFTLAESINLIKNSRLLIAPDTGFGHIAANLNTPLINLITKNFEEWKPEGNPSKIINIYSPEGYNFSLKNFFKKSGGMPNITVEQIKKAVNQLLK